MAAASAALDAFVELIYFEKQRAALCGVHALNTLLQGPYFEETQLAEIALRLDERERAVMAENGLDTAEFAAFAAEASGNVAMDGNFSIQVLDEALAAFGLSCTPLASSDPLAVAAREAPLRERAFLCNLDAHWFTLRRLGREWWNLNSLNAAPEPVSDTYLRELLAQLRAEGYTLFLVHGAWQARNSMYGEAAPDGVWLSRKKAEELRAEAQRAKLAGRTRTAAENALARAARGGGQLTLRRWNGAQDDGDDPELRRALAASLGEADDGWVAGGGGGSQPRAGGGASQHAPRSAEADDEALARAIAASLDDEPHAKRHEAEKPSPPAEGFDPEMDVELAAALAASLAATRAAPAVPARPVEPPREPAADEPGAMQLALRLPTGARLTRFFLASDTAEGVAAVVAAAGVDMALHTLSAGFPPRELAPRTATLGELGVTHKSMVNVQPK